MLALIIANSDIKILNLVIVVIKSVNTTVMDFKLAIVVLRFQSPLRIRIANHGIKKNWTQNLHILLFKLILQGRTKWSGQSGFGRTSFMLQPGSRRAIFLLFIHIIAPRAS